MNNHWHMAKDRPLQKPTHILKWLVGLSIFTIILIVLGAIYESDAELKDKLALPPPGKLIDIGGFRLHLNCIGTGNPTVVVESGWGDFSSSWGWVQPEVAKATRICTYDRAGMGWSEMSTKPRTAREFAFELHTLLKNAKEYGPYILVGHSMGGYTVRVYAHDYPTDVSGLIFVDPQNISISGNNFNPAPKPETFSIPMLLAQVGFMRIFAGPFGAVQDLPEKVKNAYTAYSVTPRTVQTFLNEGRGMSEGVAQARAVTTLGTLPIILISRGKDLDAESAASQKRYLELSANSEHVVAEKSGHRIMIEQPEAVISAILKMVANIRRDSSK